MTDCNQTMENVKCKICALVFLQLCVESEHWTPLLHTVCTQQHKIWHRKGNWSESVKKSYNNTSTLDQFELSSSGIKEVEIIFARKLLKSSNGSLFDKCSGQMSTLHFINIVLLYCGWHKERWKLIFNPVICDATDGGVECGDHWPLVTMGALVTPSWDRNASN